MTLIELVEMWGIFGIISGILGGILLFRFSQDPYERHVEEWIQIQKKIYPKTFEQRIQRTFNYWRKDANMDLPHPTVEWLVPEKFAEFWRSMRVFSFTLLIGGATLLLIQMIID